jgi:hypothetical protein
MRLWSIHPKYLDTKGLVALWREALLAKHVLEGKTKGYKNHPQLIRFKDSKSPVDAINLYLTAVYDESTKRNYHFDKTKINDDFRIIKLPVTKGQIDYEINHLLKKLKTRDTEKYKELKKKKIFTVHPMFKRVPGKVEDWEIITV